MSRGRCGHGLSGWKRARGRQRSGSVRGTYLVRAYSTPGRRWAMADGARPHTIA
nr:hypothetical protein RVX_3239 [Nitratidesulfovibrio sp. HK-II]